MAKDSPQPTTSDLKFEFFNINLKPLRSLACETAEEEIIEGGDEDEADQEDEDPTQVCATYDT